MPIAQSTEQSTNGDLLSDVGSEIKVAIDRWSAGQLGLSDLLVAGAIVAFAVVAAWFVRTLARRWTADMEGPAASAGTVLGQLLSLAIYLLSMGLVLEVLGFGLGPALIIILIIVIAVMLLGPTMRHLSSGLILQVRGPFMPGDVIGTHDLIGVVDEVNTRTVILIASDGTTVHIPTSKVLDSLLINYSTIGRRRSALTLRLTGGPDLPGTMKRIEEAVSGAGSHVLDEPPPAAVVTGFEGAQVCIEVLFWHRPELWAERIARDRVGRALVGLFQASDLHLADPGLVVTSNTPTRSSHEQDLQE